MTTPLTPSAKAIRAADRAIKRVQAQGGPSLAVAALAAAFPHLRRQIIAECVRVIEPQPFTSHIGPLHGAGVVDGVRSCQRVLRALLGDATDGE